MNSDRAQAPRALLTALALSSAVAALSIAAASFLRFAGAIEDHRRVLQMIASDLQTQSWDVPTWFLVTVSALDVVSFLTAALWLVCAVTGWAVERRAVPAKYVGMGFVFLLIIPRATPWVARGDFWMPHTLMPLGVIKWAVLGTLALGLAAIALWNMRPASAEMSWTGRSTRHTD